MSKGKSFLNLTKFEVKRIFRNKVILFFLVLLPIILLLILSTMNVDKANYKIGIYKDGLRYDQIELMTIIDKNMATNNLVEFEDIDQGIAQLNKGEIQFLICIDSSTSPITAKIIFDGSSEVGNAIKSKVNNAINEYAYKTLTEEFAWIDWNDSYFHTITFESISGQKTPYAKRIFPLEVSCFVSLILLFGLSYSVSRDNETGVNKQISYTPIGLNKYMLSKLLPYCVLGLFELVAVYGLGALLFSIKYETNIFLIIIVSMFFIFATLSIGLLFSLQKNQIATAFLDMLIILLPTFALSTMFLDAFPLIIKFLLYFAPITPFMQMLKYMVFNGVFLWKHLMMLIIQTIIYYQIALIILKRRSSK